ncbi:hypothetical protein GH741_06785 [Aquibacillus halophilus]|uniref:Uncharacterized protein n=2 Tax=Aquibacillus halophilus TaxID=930132 RepID=A0A6A8DHL1_9BACI|nr:hypothetical protein [Aquibacillus halophilus]MRH42387.1 hypothetical protein [Aquibacillus halophilus]
MKKNTYRIYLALWVLSLIAFSSSELFVGNTKINVSIIVLYIGALLLLASTSSRILNVMRSLCFVFGYVGLLFWEQISPVWLIIPRVIMIPFLGFILLILLTKNNVERIAIWCLGVTTGEVLHSLILNSYGFNDYIGDMAFFDILITGIGIIVAAAFLLEVRSKLDHMIELIEKQKKRWSQ